MGKSWGQETKAAGASSCTLLIPSPWSGTQHGPGATSWFQLALLEFCQPPHRALWQKVGSRTPEECRSPSPSPSPLPPIDSVLHTCVSHGGMSGVDVRWQTTAHPVVGTTLNWLLKFKNGKTSQRCGFLASLGVQAGLAMLSPPPTYRRCPSWDGAFRGHGFWPYVPVWPA